MLKASLTCRASKIDLEVEDPADITKGGYIQGLCMVVILPTWRGSISLPEPLVHVVFISVYIFVIKDCDPGIQKSVLWLTQWKSEVCLG